MNKNIGYNLDATLYTLEDEKIMSFKCKKNGRRYENGSFVGSGFASQGQTLEIATKDKLPTNIKATQVRCEFEGNMYIVMGIFTQDVSPIKNKYRKVKDTILALQ